MKNRLGLINDILFFIIIIFATVSFVTAVEETNNTIYFDNQTNSSNETIVETPVNDSVTVQDDIIDNSTTEEREPLTIEFYDINTSLENESTTEENITIITTPTNTTNINITEEPILTEDFIIVNMTPKEAIIGDILLTISVKNIGTKTLENLVPLIVATGFSTYDTLPLTFLQPDETNTMLVSGNFASQGTIIVTIKINNKVFYETIKVTLPPVNVEEIKMIEENKKQLTEHMSLQL